MKEIIFFNISEQTPTEEGSRLNRTGQLSFEFANNGYKTTWVSSTFSHINKRYLKFYEKRDFNNLKFHFLRSFSYQKNISMIRVANNFFLAFQAFYFLIKHKKPDIIYCYTPPIELAFVAAIYSKFFSITFVLDVRDNWPDSFVYLFPYSLRFITKILFFPWRLMLKFSFRQATKILASSRLQAEFASKYTQDPDKTAKVFYIGDNVPEIKFSSCETDNINLLFVGTLTNARPLFSTINNLNRLKHKNYFLSVIGDGDNLDQYKALSSLNNNILFHGRKTGEELHKYIQESDILIAPYEEAGYGWSMPAKISSYIGFGRPIVTNIGYETQEFLERYSLGSIINFENLDDFTSAIDFWARVNKDKHLKNARKVYEENFDMKKIAKYMKDYISDT